MKYFHNDELVATTSDGRFRRLVVQEKLLRSGTLSFAANDRVEEHLHPGSDEVFHVISGRGRIVVEDQALDIGPGDLVYIAAGERHTVAVDVAATEPFVFFAVVAPHLGDDAVFTRTPVPAEA
jgi:mannose-6-phosphate isomerase-like protein (cupin superfamily)